MSADETRQSDEQAAVAAALNQPLHTVMDDYLSDHFNVLVTGEDLDGLAAVVMPAVERIVAERLAASSSVAVQNIGDSLAFWMNLAKTVTRSDDLIDQTGDGDWMAVADRLAALGRGFLTSQESAAAANALARDLIQATHPDNPDAPLPMVRSGCAEPLAEALYEKGWRLRGDSDA